MISGLWSNGNLDDGKDTRSKMLQEIEDTYQQSIDLIYSREKQEEIDFKSDPFFAAMKLPPEPFGPGEERAPGVSPTPEPTTMHVPEDEIDQG